MSARRRLLLAVVLGAAVAAGGLTLAGRAGGPSAGVSSACPADGPEQAVSLVPLVRLSGRTYVYRSELPVGVRTDRVVGTTRCRLSTRTPADRRPQDGDSTALAPGTPVLALAGVDPAVAVTALVGERHLRFEALPGLDLATCAGTEEPDGAGHSAGDPACAFLPGLPSGQPG